MRFPIVTRAVGLSRAVSEFGSVNDGETWNVSMPKVCSTTRPTSLDSGLLRACVARVRRMLLGATAAPV